MTVIAAPGRTTPGRMSGRGPGAPARARAGRRRWAAAAALLAIVVFGAESWLALRLDALHAFGQYNLLFDADASARLETFSHGYGADARSLQHPALSLYVSVPVRLVTAGAGVVAGGAAEPRAVRRSLALRVAPLAASVSVVALLFTLALMGLRLSAAAAGAVVGAASFSPLLFGAVPDHFAVSGAVLSVTLLAAVATARTRRVRPVVWCILGMAAAGVTLTNGLAVSATFATALVGAGWAFRRAVVLATGVGTASLLLTLGVAAAGNAVYATGQAASVDASSVWARQYLRSDGIAALQFPAAVANGIAPAAARVIADSLAVTQNARYSFRFTLGAHSNRAGGRAGLLGWMVLAVAGIGALSLLRGTPAQRTAAAAALVLLLFNLALHAVWGGELILYSQHWSPAVALLVGGLAAGRSGGRATGLLGFLAAAILAWNVVRIGEIVRRLEAVDPPAYTFSSGAASSVASA